MSNNKKPGPLTKLYYQAGSFGGALTLANMIDDIVKWKGLIGEMLGVWILVVHPIFDYTIGLPFELFQINVPDPIKDYCLIGMVMGGSYVRLHIAHNRSRTTTTIDDDYYDIRFLIITFVFNIVAWPLFISELLYPSVMALYERMYEPNQLREVGHGKNQTVFTQNRRRYRINVLKRSWVIYISTFAYLVFLITMDYALFIVES